MIGGLGSDTINVASSVTADIQTRELEGASGAVNHLVRSTDPAYDLLPAPGIDYNVATPAQGGVVITEVTATGAPTEDGLSLVREGGLSVNGSLVLVDRYLVHLAAAPTGTVYVTVSAACSPLDEANGTCLATRPVGAPVPDDGDTILLASGAATPAPSAFYRVIQLNGVATWVPNRTLVLVFDASNWDLDQTVWLTAVDDKLAEGPRVVTISHSVISADARLRQRRRPQRRGDGARQRPGRARDHAARRRRQPRTSSTVVIEGTAVTQQLDTYRLSLAKEPASGKVVKVKIDASADGRIQFCVTAARARPPPTGSRRRSSRSVPAASTGRAGSSSGFARVDDFVNQDPQTSVLTHSVVARRRRAPRHGLHVREAAARRRHLRRRHAERRRRRDRRPDAAPQERPALLRQLEAVRHYSVRLTQQPTGNVTVSIVGDGQADVVAINGVAISPSQYAVIGGIRPSTQFTGNITTTATTITRAAGSELGSFDRDGFKLGQLIQVQGFTATYTVLAVSDTSMTVALAVAGTQFGSQTLDRREDQRPPAGRHLHRRR